MAFKIKSYDVVLHSYIGLDKSSNYNYSNVINTIILIFRFLKELFRQ